MTFLSKKILSVDNALCFISTYYIYVEVLILAEQNYFQPNMRAFCCF